MRLSKGKKLGKTQKKKKKNYTFITSTVRREGENWAKGFLNRALIFSLSISLFFFFLRLLQQTKDRKQYNLYSCLTIYYLQF